MTPDEDNRTPPTDDDRGEGTPAPDQKQAAHDPRGADKVRRELGPGDGDDPPPDQDDEPLRR